MDEDLGLACEIGYFAALCAEDKNREIIAIYSDSRDGSREHSLDKEELMRKSIAESQFSYINLYLVGAVKKSGKIFRSSKEAIEYLKSKYQNR